MKNWHSQLSIYASLVKIHITVHECRQKSKPTQDLYQKQCPLTPLEGGHKLPSMQRDIKKFPYQNESKENPYPHILVQSKLFITSLVIQYPTLIFWERICFY